MVSGCQEIVSHNDIPVVIRTLLNTRCCGEEGRHLLSLEKSSLDSIVCFARAKRKVQMKSTRAISNPPQSISQLQNQLGKRSRSTMNFIAEVCDCREILHDDLHFIDAPLSFL